MENIKYHQHGLGNEYGADHKLTDNWDPDKDYGNEYVNVYFHIDTPSYGYNIGWNNADRDAWEEEASSLIRSFGILEGTGFDAEKRKCAYLYAHPQQFSGVILKNDVKKVAEAISNMKLSSIRYVALHDTVYVISDIAYESYLDGRKGEIRKALFEKTATSRTTYFCNAYEVARNIAAGVRLNRLGYNDGRNYGGGPTIDYILKVAEEMITEGYLKRMDHNEVMYIRSLNKTEQKKNKMEFTG